MTEFLSSSAYFGLALSVGTYILGSAVRRRWNYAILNPLLLAIVLIILLLSLCGIPYRSYDRGAKYLSYFLTPATVCLALPLYRQLHRLKNNAAGILCGIDAGVAARAASIFVMARCLGLSRTGYVTRLPKSITTAIGMGISAEAGGIVTITVISIVITGILENIIAEPVTGLFRITDPVAKGLAIGTSAHAIGTVKALEMGEVEGAMSSLAVAVAGLVTVLVVPFAAGLY
ncbi:MAG: LrgB family protein [Cloacibacillus sp.]|nr:LrgB family protein [Cloacibacillus sp.]